MNKKVKIGPQTFDVIVRQGLFDRDTKLDGQIAFGESNIYIDERLDAFSARQTLWHEIIHGVVTQIGADVSEKTIDALAYGILGVLKDNKWLRNE